MENTETGFSRNQGQNTETVFIRYQIKYKDCFCPNQGQYRDCFVETRDNTETVFVQTRENTETVLLKPDKIHRLFC